MNTTANNVMTCGNADLSHARHELAVAVGSQYGAMRAYAIALNAAFEFAWYEVKHTDTGDQAKMVHAEKRELFAELKAVNHSNPSTIWARVRDYAKEEREGKQEEGEAHANEPRTPMIRNCEDLLALYKFNARQEDLPQRVKQAQAHIEKALNALGVDLSNI